MQPVMTSLAFVTCAGLLSACGAPVGSGNGTAPVMNILIEPDGSETVLTGTFDAPTPSSRSFQTQSEDGSVTCNGSFTFRGSGFVTCSNGWEIALQLPRSVYEQPDGTLSEVSGGIGSAIGWGRFANIDHLRRMLGQG